MAKLTHLDQHGRANMVDIGQKSVSRRTAVATAVVKTSPEVIKMIAANAIKKGDVLAAARLAGIMAAKKTSELIPLCHPIPIDTVSIDLDLKKNTIQITATAMTTAKTGIEMEALTAASLAALTIYDMCKAVDKLMTIEKIQLEKKTGGKSGKFARSTAD